MRWSNRSFGHNSHPVIIAVFKYLLGNGLIQFRQLVRLSVMSCRNGKIVLGLLHQCLKLASRVTGLLIRGPNAYADNIGVYFAVILRILAEKSTRTGTMRLFPKLNLRDFAQLPPPDAK